MRLFCYLTISVMFLSLFAGSALAQRTRTETYETAKERREKESAQARKMVEGMRRSEAALESLENYSRPRSSADVLRERKIEIARNLKQLNEMSDALKASLSAPPPPDCDFKETAELANKVAKLSKRLRKDLDLEAEKVKWQPVSLPAETERLGQMRHMVEEIDRMVEEVNQAQSDNSVDASKLQQTGDNLQSIEQQANNVRLLARGKK